MHDEFSALFRTGYDSFQHLIQQGVATDAHPAAVQVFLWLWVKLVGFDEFWVKLPFAAMGIATVYLFYRIGKLWFNETAGLIAASWMASMQFFVFYSQLARPYAAGLFVLLWMVLLWTRIIQKEKSYHWEWVLFSISIALTALVHAFSTLAAGLIYITGLFLVANHKRIAYLSAGLLSLLLYAPYIPIFWQQLNRGDIGGWLGQPQPSFLIEFMWYGFHFDSLYVVISIIIILLLISNNSLQNKRKNYFRFIAILWFTATYLIAYFYSIYRVPILQFSTLYFGFPFLLLAMASFVREQRWPANLLITSILLLSGLFGLIHKRAHYDMMYKQGFDQIAIENARAKSSYGNELLMVTRSASPDMTAFYLEKEDLTGVVLFSGQEQYADLHTLLSDSSKYDYLAFSWTDYARLEWVEVARDHYPFTIDYHSWFNAEFYLLSKMPLEGVADRTGHEMIIINDSFSDGEVRFDSNRIYGPLLELPLDSIRNMNYHNVVFSALIAAHDTLDNVRLVFEIKDADNGEVIHWQAGELLTDNLLPGEKQRLISANRIPGLRLPKRPLLLRCYIWNPDGQVFSQLDHKLTVQKQSSRILGLFEPL
mgnify:CR=1 FL=1